MYITVKIMTMLLSLIYSIIKFFTPVKNKITLISRQSDEPSLDFKLLINEIKKAE